MRFWVYVLLSQRTCRRYVGSTTDLNRRLSEHNRGQTASTRGGTPWMLIHTEAFETHTQAAQRERFLKTGRGRAELDQFTG